VRAKSPFELSAKHKPERKKIMRAMVRNWRRPIPLGGSGSPVMLPMPPSILHPKSRSGLQGLRCLWTEVTLLERNDRGEDLALTPYSLRMSVGENGMLITCAAGEEGEMRSTVLKAFLSGTAFGIGMTLLSLYTRSPSCFADSAERIAEMGRRRRAKREERGWDKAWLKAAGFSDEEIREVF
jgi:hypothetical protein